MGIDEAGVRIEPLETAVDHVLDELALGVGVERPHVLVLDLLHDLDDQADEGVVLVLLASRGTVRDRVAQQNHPCDTQ